MSEQTIGPYQLLEELGRGAMGVVFRGFDPRIGRPVAIKVIKAEQSASPEEKAKLKLRFAREAKAAGSLLHPNIVTIFDFEKDGEPQYLVMELVKGCSLEETLSTGRPQDRKTALAIVTQVADALDYAHGEGIVHRDVKPANILVRPDGKVKITDFGIARIVSDTVTLTGITMGTPAYMSPEQVTTSKVSGLSDQFSLGVIAYQMLAGKRPFAAEGLAVMLQIMMEEPPPVHTVNSAITPRTSEVVAKALAKKPGDRFANCREFAKRLSESFEGAEAESRDPQLETTATMPTVRTVGDGEGEAASPELVAPVLRAGTTKVNPKDGLTYVWIPAGEFQMGCSAGDNECYDNEKPAHQVTITKGFWIGQTPVTQEAWQRVMGTNPSHFKGPKLPVESVSWDDAKSYCQAVGMRLPTEAEWEYAARARSSASRYGKPDEIAWHSGNSRGKTHEVGGWLANEWGLFDMLGNVWEWVADWHAEYPAGSATDPTGPTSGTHRVLRGGSWVISPRFARESIRFRFGPAYRNYDIGFRCAGN